MKRILPLLVVSILVLGGLGAVAVPEEHTTPETLLQPELEIKIIGAKPGEKLYEELMTHEEIRRTIELENYFVIYPIISYKTREIKYSYPSMVHSEIETPYHSANEPPLSQEELKKFLYENQLLEGEDERPFQPLKRY